MCSAVPHGRNRTVKDKDFSPMAEKFKIREITLHREKDL